MKCTALVATALLAIALSSPNSQAQSACKSVEECLERSQLVDFDRLQASHFSAARRLNDARARLGRAIAIHDSRLVEQMQRSVAQAEYDWRSVDDLVRSMESEEYRQHLLVNLRDESGLAKQARDYEARVARIVEMLAEFRRSSADQQERIRRDMRALLEDRERQLHALKSDLLLAALHTGVHVGSHFAEAASKVDRETIPIVLEKIGAVASGAASEMRHGGDDPKWAAIGHLAHSFGMYVVSTMRDTNPTNPRNWTEWMAGGARVSVLETAGWAPVALSVGLDLALLGNTNLYYAEAKRRLDAVTDADLASREFWGSQLKMAKDQLRNLETRQGLAAAVVSKQEALVAKAREVRASVK